jgi:hypothetical protein
VGEALRLDRVVLGDDSRRVATVSPSAKAGFPARSTSVVPARSDFRADRESNR